MANAFKCDICGEFKEGTPTILSFRPYTFNTDTTRFDICGMCHMRINELFDVIAREHNFVNDFNSEDL